MLASPIHLAGLTVFALVLESQKIAAGLICSEQMMAFSSWPVEIMRERASNFSLYYCMQSATCRMASM
jgi:hypothetical protein